ncbi:callose synthase 12 [Senna tora]|uniref:Callose synthase 12 n=1 Tax=Senna tora TaxID=362788 RepID=A0A834TK56_9FABA|nr:callose synthase 12 [Senna tora]
MIYAVVSCAHEKCAAKLHIYYCVVLLIVISVVTIVITALVKFTALKFVDILTGILAFVTTGVVSVARLYDILFGMIVMAPMVLLSWLPVKRNTTHFREEETEQRELNRGGGVARRKITKAEHHRVTVAVAAVKKDEEWLSEPEG